MAKRPGSRTRTRVRVVQAGEESWRADHLATEEPLEIRLVAGGETRTIAVTMRTPGADFELAAGFLFGEGIIAARGEVQRISYCTDRDVDPIQLYNIVNVELTASTLPDLRRLERHFYTTSACGVCGKASLESLELRGCVAPPAGPCIEAELVHRLPRQLREAQGLFDSTGGLHAAGLFTASGELLCLREDVGRHNAVDKLVGWSLLEGRLPLADSIVMVSGRSSFEIMQKALAAGVPIVCAVSAPSSLAVALARRFGITLIGFLRAERFNVYSGEDRIRPAALVEVPG
ncbi:MAG TPA: formate dehydrogenase accessory sulfurtransferase FdhD [Longimicrobiaceae bacterium]|nr:formate dehydrogenase accessory sulfurtransferase FdhD [Longimicrobiaceae bacterium]